MPDGAMPRKSPCASCPYRKNVPSGIWHPEEYDKLPRYDEETFAQPVELFMCHQGEGDVCTGWLCRADPGQLLAVRMGLINGTLAPEALDHTTTVPLFASGREAAEHGKRDELTPDERARSAISKIVRKHDL